MIEHIVIPVLERDDVWIDEQKISEGLSLQKYFPYKLIAWEIFLFALIVGVFTKDGDNFFKDIRVMVGRGSGKNGFISFLCFYFLSPFHGVRGYNIDLMANSEQQAKTSFNDVYEVIKKPHDPKHLSVLKSNFYATKEEILSKTTQSILRFNTSSKRGKDSKRTGCVIFDEKHEYMDTANINTLTSGLGKVPFGREITITTDGHVRGAVLDKEKEQNADILKAYDKNNRTLVFWCKIEHKDEWKDVQKLVKAIPSLNHFKSLRSTIEKEIADMRYKQDYLPEFMAKRCNFPIGNADVEVTSWDNILATNQPMPDLEGLCCVGGVDFAQTNDFVACGLLFLVGGKYAFVHHTFVCAQSRDLGGIKPPLDEWEQAGDLTMVRDVVVPADMVAEWFEKQRQKYLIKEIALDSYRYTILGKELGKIGFSCQSNIPLVRPNDIRRIAPLITVAFETNNIVFGDVPIMRWYTHNTKKIMDQHGNITYGKIEPRFRKTDGFMAFVSCMTRQDQLIDMANPVQTNILKTVTY